MTNPPSKPGMTKGQWLGLIGLVAYALILPLVLLFDLILYLTGRLTISQQFWARWGAWKAYTIGSGPYAPFPWEAVWLPALTSAGGVFLAIHFFS